MTELSLKSLPPQAQTLYHLLIGNNPMTAKEIGEKLGILPHAVYRSMGTLIKMGLIQSIGKYPVKFTARPASDALDAYLLTTRESLLKTFFPHGIANDSASANETLGISFLQDRTQLLEQSNNDMKKAKRAANFIVSGLEVPTDTILEYKQAVDRGVQIRVLVQQLDEVSKEMFLNWKKIGIEVRYFPLLEARILIFDKEIVYITSYNPRSKEECIGIRFAYPPVTKLMNELFENRWKQAKEINH